MSPAVVCETSQKPPRLPFNWRSVGGWPAIFGLAVAGLLLLIAWLFFGSMHALGAAIAGHKLCAIEPYRRVEFAATDQQLMVDFQIQNLRWNEVEISGAQISCSCTVLPQMPLKIAPFETISLPLKIHLGAEPTAQRLDMALFVDGPNERVPLSTDVVKRDR